MILRLFLRKKVVTSRFLFNCVAIWVEIYYWLTKVGLVTHIELNILFSYCISSVFSFIMEIFSFIYLILSIIWPSKTHKLIFSGTKSIGIKLTVIKLHLICVWRFPLAWDVILTKWLSIFAIIVNINFLICLIFFSIVSPMIMVGGLKPKIYARCIAYIYENEYFIPKWFQVFTSIIRRHQCTELFV